MKKNLNIGKFLILIIFIGLILMLIIGRNDNENIETKNIKDRDDINLIEKIGKQSFDKAKNINYKLK